MQELMGFAVDALSVFLTDAWRSYFSDLRYKFLGHTVEDEAPMDTATASESDTVSEFLENLPKCPICIDTFENPLVGDCGHSFCHACILEALDACEEETTCPLCKSPNPQFRHNFALREAIAALQPKAVAETAEGESGSSKKPATDKKTTEWLCREAVEAFRQGDALRAIQLCSGALEEESQPSEARRTLLYNRGSSYRDFGQYYLAIADFASVLQREPRHGKSLNKKAQCLVRLGRFYEALECYRELKEIPEWKESAKKEIQKLRRAVDLMGVERPDGDSTTDAMLTLLAMRMAQLDQEAGTNAEHPRDFASLLQRAMEDWPGGDLQRTPSGFAGAFPVASRRQNDRQ